MLKETMRAYVVSQEGDQVKGEVTTLSTDQLPAGDVTIEVEYSSLNYKDGLACMPKGGIVRSYPHIPGIDAAGRVVESQDAAFAMGDRVLITGYDLGVAHWGGYAEYVRVPASWVVKTPDNLSHAEAMTLGTAGFTAAMCLLAMERNGATPEQGPVLVTGATGGVGSVAVNMLAQKGYTVAASTGKADQHDYLRDLGASEILSREEVSMTDERPRPLLKATWAGAVDTVGGSTLSYLLRTTDLAGNIALCGLVGGHNFNGTVIPFLLRGINLLGIDSVTCPMPYRTNIWQRLASDLKPGRLDQMAQAISLEGVTDAVSEILQGKVKGRMIVTPH